MFSTRRLRTGASLAIVLCTVLLVASIAGPAVGAPSPLDIAKKALKGSKKANKTANGANKRSKSALSAAKSAKSAAAAAGAKAAQALAAPDTGGPAAIRTNGGVDVPTDGSVVEDAASCPAGYFAAGGGVGVYADNGDPIAAGAVVTQSTLDRSGTKWRAAMQDVSGAANRNMVITVTCAKPSSLDIGPVPTLRRR